MKAPFLPIAFALLAACSDDEPAQQSSETPPAVAEQTPASPQPAPEQADMAASEITEPAQPASDPCDLSGYDMSKMTVDQHEELVKICERSKQ